MASERFRKALSGAVKRAEDRQWIFGTLGRQDSDGGHTFVVPGRRGFVYVTIRQGNGAQTVVPARNDFGIEHRFNVGVRMKLEHGVYVVLGRANRADLVNTPDAPEYGVFAHATTHQHGGSDEIATLTPAPFAIPKANASGWLDDWIENAGYTQEEIEDFVAAQFVGNTGVIDATYNDTTGAITLTLDVSAADRYLYSTGADTWAEGTITSFARGLLDDADAATMRTTLGISVYDQETTEDIIGASITDGNGINATYDDGTGLVTLALTTLTSDWDIGEDRRILLEALRARDGEGILLEDDAGNVGLAVLDGGKIVVVGADDFVRPYLASVFDGQNNVGLVVRQPVSTSSGSPFATIVLSNNQSDATLGNIASVNFMNEAIPGDEKRLGQLLVRTDDAIDAGQYIFRTFDAGSVFDVLTLFSSGYAQFLSHVGIGTSPQGILHTYANGAGHLIVTKTGVNGTPQVIIPNGTGDVTVGCRARYVLVTDGGVFGSGEFNLSGAGAGDSHNISIAGVIWTVTRNGNGEVSIARTSGSGTITITFDIIWI